MLHGYTAPPSTAAAHFDQVAEPAHEGRDREGGREEHDVAELLDQLQGLVREVLARVEPFIRNGGIICLFVCFIISLFVCSFIIFIVGSK